MKLSLNWIKDYVELPADLEISRLAYDLTMSTVEVESAEKLNFDKMVVGKIVEILPHPDADKLKLCKTDIGGEIKEIVCGGSNLENGQKVAVAKPGAMVRWHGEGDLVEIKLAKVRGVESFGMICASSEIGLFDLFPFDQVKDEATIMDISAWEAEAGTSLAEALGLDDIILEIDNKSMTNRPDLWGHYGIARELAALYGLPLKELKKFEVPSVEEYKIILEDTSRCPRYIGIKMEGLSNKPASFEIQSRLWRVGLRPINAIVDITNYVMLATGQPTHAFDSDHIKGHITVRRAHEGEKLLLLNGKELDLNPEVLVIADEADAVALAGVMGGEKDSILPNTSKVILEIANFEAMSTRRTAARYEVRTDAATRFEKGVDPERCDLALSISMEMFKEAFPEMAITAYGDNNPTAPKRSEIEVSLSWMEKRLGKGLSNDVITSKLKSLGFEVSISGDKLQVIAPTWRSTGDVSIPDDILEEVARMYGYENFEPSLIYTSFEGAINQPNVDIDRKLREYLAFRCGMQEIFTYPWLTTAYQNALFGSTEGLVSLAAPPSPEEKYICASLVPNLCKAVSENLRFYNGFSIFESAQVFSGKFAETPYDSRESLPQNRRNIAGACVGSYDAVDELFRQTKGIIESMPRFIHFDALCFKQMEKPPWADNIVWLNIVSGGTGPSGEEKIGSLALLSKKAALDCGIKNSAVMLFEMDIDALKPYLSRTNEFRHLSEYPTTDYDISLLFDLSVKWEEISEIAAGKPNADNLVQAVSFVDEYRGKQVPEGKKSLTFRLVIGSPKKTLTSDEIENCANAVVKRLGKRLGAERR